MRSFAAIWVLAVATITAELIKVADFGNNPSDAGMHIYLLAKKTEKPAIVVAASPNVIEQRYLSKGVSWLYCRAVANMTDGKCWDVGTKASLPNGPGAGGDTFAIVNMVKYALTKYNADPKKMTIAAVYPDIFAGGAAYSGLPSGCLAGSPGFGPFTADQTCANGKKNRSPTERELERGPDFVVKYPNLAEGLKQWSNLHGVPFTKNASETPGKGYTELVYGDGTKLVGYSGQGVGHSVPVHEAESLKFWGL